VFQNETLKTHLETSQTISSQSAIIAEWNMNVPGNIFKLGNYRYRYEDEVYGILPDIFNPNEETNQVIGGTKFYAGATDADVVIETGYENDAATPLLFQYKKDIEKNYYSLEDCIKPFRPRSGINRLSYFDNNSYLSHPNPNMYLRPRYYMNHRENEFKYWRSYRTESINSVTEDQQLWGIEYPGDIDGANIERGVSKNNNEGIYYIDDANPFVVYKEQVPANRIVIKVQTHVGNIDLGPFTSANGGTFNDPFYGDENKVVPQRFAIQYLTSNDKWVTILSFDQTSLRDDGSPIFSYDGHLSIEYGLVVPSEYTNNFLLVGTTSSASSLPIENVIGHAYLVSSSPTDLGILYIYNGENYDQYTPEYNWRLGSDGAYENTQFVTDLTNPSYYLLTGDPDPKYREFVWIKGIRVAVESMSLPDKTLDLIEMSPRLAVDFTPKVTNYDITKTLGDLSSTSLPMGEILASTGSITIFDDDQSFNQNNQWDFATSTGSIIAKYVSKNVKFIFYEIIKNVDDDNYYIPIKYLYSEGIPVTDSTSLTVSITLRDFYFYFESMSAPRILIPEASLSQAVCLLLDAIGFSNYVFKRLEGESDPVIPYFFVGPDQNVAEVLRQLAISTQSAMFFDEYNNFVVMSKNYMLDDTEERDVDITLYGTNNQSDTGVIENSYTNPLTNIISINASNLGVINSGVINYTSRYIQKTTGSLQPYPLIDKTWRYKPTLLWEVSGTVASRSANARNQDIFSLSAVPLNSNLSEDLPTVRERNIINNIIDIGENAYWLSRFQGYLYANAEIIRYDAVEFSITGTGNVWISSNLEYQKYFASLPFNGKLYPTGRVRIFSEPYYENINGVTYLQNGEVLRHGRGQYGTPITNHQAGLSDYWSSKNNVYGCNMRSEFLFEQTGLITIFGVSSSTNKLLVLDTSRVRVGQIVKIISGTGTLPSGNTTVTAVATTKTTGTDYFEITISQTPTVALSNATVTFSGEAFTENGAAGLNATGSTSKILAERSKRNGIIRNLLSTFYNAETDVALLKTTVSGTIQSSALVFNGPDFNNDQDPRDFISYVYKALPGTFKHFGTRLRIIGKVDASGNLNQTPVGGMTYFTIPNVNPTQTVSIGGGSAGVCLVNPTTNNGYFFELAALTSSNIQSFLDLTQEGTTELVLDNIMFYKIKKEIGSSDAIPIKLWGGIGQVTVDDGNFTGQYRYIAEENPTVFDLAIEYIDINANLRRFYLYINNSLVKVIDDTEPIPLTNNMGVFVRGTSRVMFENVYALGKNYAYNISLDTDVPISSRVFGDQNNQIDATEALRKYALSGVVQQSYLSGINPNTPPAYSLYFEEFGTILRECSYFNIKYDKAYPSLYAIIAPTFNRIRGYSVSGFTADSYGAEFLVFNNTDTILNLDETTGNYLRIIGAAFTQDTTNKVTVDDFLRTKGNLSDPELKGDAVIGSPFVYREVYDKVRTSRLLYGVKEFTLDTMYIQDQDTAEDILSWIINKNIEPRKNIVTTIFPNPMIQLGDIVKINYQNNEGINVISDPDTRFVVYNITYSKTVGGPIMNLSLSEV
jgi:hypothetical protein